MEASNRGVSLITLSLFLLLSTTFPHHFSAANQLTHNKKSIPQISIHSLVSSIVYPIKGNVYPHGYYTVSINIGNPPKLFELDIDTGSDFSWVQCDAPCESCTVPKDKLYKPHGNLVKCSDPMCPAVPSTPDHRCDNPTAPCVYEVEYTDEGSSRGLLVRDYMHMRSIDGSAMDPLVAFGCGNNQIFSGNTPPPSTVGVLGLGNGKTSILHQLHTLGFIRNVLGHCLSSQGGGYLFFGDKFIPLSEIFWTPIVHSSSKQHYNIGPADLLFNEKPTPIKGIQLIFDSGSSYTYFNSPVYEVIVKLVSDDLNGKPLTRATEDPSLPICWKGVKPFKSLNDVKGYFKLLTLSFTKLKNPQFQLPPTSYLIITQYGNVCLGILNGTQIGLGNRNVIGDISFQDKLIIYDNEKQQIGWTSADCNQLPP